MKGVDQDTQTEPLGEETDWKAMYEEALTEVAVQKNNLTSSATLLRKAQEDLQAAQELSQELASQRDKVRPTLLPHMLG